MPKISRRACYAMDFKKYIPKNEPSKTEGGAPQANTNMLGSD
jgi:hypothetical protein